MASTEERAHRRAAIAGVMERIGAKPYPTPELPSDCVFLTSIDNRFRGMKGGVVQQVGKRAAAEAIVDGTHCLSTDDEIEAYHANEAEKKHLARVAEMRAKGQAVIYVEPPATAQPSATDGPVMPVSHARKERPPSMRKTGEENR